jgi:hypothetical protein
MSPDEPDPNPTWERIRDYFDEDQVDCMKSVKGHELDLWKYEVVKDRAGDILQMVFDRKMPPGADKYPNAAWSEQKMLNFKTWMDRGCPER